MWPEHTPIIVQYTSVLIYCITGILPAGTNYMLQHHNQAQHIILHSV